MSHEPAVILGPLFRVELLRLARRGVHFRLRVVLVVVLLLGLLATYLRTFPNTSLGGLLFRGTEDDTSRLNKFGENFLLAFLVVQQIAVLLITPVYAGGAIADEKERGGLDFLLTTPLSRWELVVGKLAARLTFVLAVLATGLPVLFLTLMFGGVSVERVLAGFVVSAVTAIAIASFATMMSVYRHTLRDVLLWTYGGIAALTAITAMFGACADDILAQSPLGIFWVLFAHWNQNKTPDPTWPLVILYSCGYLICATGFLVRSLKHIRGSSPTKLHDPVVLEETEVASTSTPSDNPPLPDWYQIPERPSIENESQEQFTAGRGFAVRPMGQDVDPFVWKERYFSGRLPLMESTWVTMIVGIAVTAFLFVLCAGWFVGATAKLSRGEWIDEPVNVVSRIFLVAAVLAVPILGVRTAVSVTEEKAKQTLLSLLMLPVPNQNILRAKVCGAILRTKWLLIGIGTTLGVALFTGGIHPVGIASATVFIIGYSAFVTTLGMWLSVRCASSVRAVLFLLLCVLATVLMPVIFGPVIKSAFSSRDIIAWMDAISSPISVWEATGLTIFGHSNVNDRPNSINLVGAIRSIVIGLIYATAACLIWLAAVRRFDRYGRS